MPEQSYMMLMRELDRRLFYPAIPNDDNRAADGLTLRAEYGGEVSGACSVLEMMIALCERMSFQLADYDTYGELTETNHFWSLIRNLGLEGYTDAELLDGDTAPVHEAIDRLLERRYRKDGAGGLFPLRHAKEDQRTVEIWYQMQAWLREKCE